MSRLLSSSRAWSRSIDEIALWALILQSPSPAWAGQVGGPVLDA